MKKVAIIIVRLVGILLSLLLIGCSPQEAVYTNLSGAEDEAQVVIRGEAGTDVYQVPRVDAATYVLETIEYEHAEIHDGDSYFTCDIADLASSANRTLLIITPDTTDWAHIIREVELELEALIELYEGATYSSAGTVLTIVNRDRNSINVATMRAYHTPTITNDGILIHAAQLGSGKKIGGGQRSVNEIILRQDTNYILRITNKTNSDNVISVRLSWYEHHNRSP